MDKNSRQSQKSELIFTFLLILVIFCFSTLLSTVSVFFNDINWGALTNEFINFSISELQPVEKEKYKVVEIVDGDTLKMKIDGKIETVRLLAIDAPETKNPGTPDQCFGKEATQRITELTLNRSFIVEHDTFQGTRDRYGRLLLYLWSDNNKSNSGFINDILVREGYASAYTKAKSKYLEQFIQAESVAKNKKLGMWGDACAL